MSTIQSITTNQQNQKYFSDYNFNSSEVQISEC